MVFCCYGIDCAEEALIIISKIQKLLFSLYVFLIFFVKAICFPSPHTFICVCMCSWM